ncbi:hypothetical protein [Nocardia jiangxiensis]|uniref:hypothetical protein n=1 Tax=Nocardia jiangxiensis TaxID=282685 RepID=UPI0002ED96AE|nr:hypothetical protein [Nocardia jiangxiensis]
MIGPAQALTLVREQLRTEVLPRIDETDDYARSVLIAALGVLGVLQSNTVEDTGWQDSSATRMRSDIASWAAQQDLAAIVGPALADLDGRLAGASGPRQRRDAALTTLELLVNAYWADPRSTALAHVREMCVSTLAADMKAQRDTVAGMS